MNINPAFEARPATPGQWLARTLHIDVPLLTGVLALSGAGLAILYSASGPGMDLVIRQAIRISVALVVMLLVASIPVSVYRTWAPWLYIVGILLLVAVMLLGDVSMGARRWLNFGFIHFQPSEVMKLGVPLVVAWYLHWRPPPPDWRTVAAALTLVLVPVALIAREPDMGTAMLVFSAGCFGLFLGGLKWRTIGLFALLAAIAAPTMWFFVLHDYQQERLLTFLNPARSPLGAGYHIIQSQIAIGSGGLFGKGWLNGTQAQLNFLPEQTTDFIFAVVGEEFGFLGACSLLAVYAFVIGRGLFIAVQAHDTFSRILAGSITLTFFVYVLVNAGMVSGLVPVVGVPLPLVSYGGSSMVTIMGGFGILMSISAHHKRPLA